MLGRPFFSTWRRISPRLVPLLAVISAFILGIPFIIMTGGQGDVSRGVGIAGEAYSALIEGSLGIAINDQLTQDDLALALSFLAAYQSSFDDDSAILTYRDLRNLQRTLGRLEQAGVVETRQYLATYDIHSRRYEDDFGSPFDDEALDALVARLDSIARLTPARIHALRPILEGDAENPGLGWLLDTGDLSNREARRLVADALAYPTLRAELERRSPGVIEMSDRDLLSRARNSLEKDEDLLDALTDLEELTPEDWLGDFIAAAEANIDLLDKIPYSKQLESGELRAELAIIAAEDVLTLRRVSAQLDIMEAIQLDPSSTAASDLSAIQEMGIGRLAELRAALTWLEIPPIEVDDLTRINQQLSLLKSLFDEGWLPVEDGNGETLALLTTLDVELPQLLETSLVVHRPGARVLVHEGVSATMGLIPEQIQDATHPDYGGTRTLALYLRLGGSAFLFYPLQLEDMIVRSLPYIIAGLAVALGFKAGMFNIGAEGQLYAAGIFAVFVGYAAPFTNLPAFLHLPLMMVAGILGGALWAAIPGALKAFTGAHEVITTIMLNFIAIRLTDWLIKSRHPWLMGDQNASIPRTPYIAASAEMPSFDQISIILIILAGLLVLWRGLHGNYQQVLQEPRLAIRPLAHALLVVLAGFFLQWITVRGSLHIGLLLMIAAVWFTNALLERTTPGFELRSVGANPNAARYAGMSVKRNIILAMALSGALAGLAGAIEISSVQKNLQPDYFLGLGFEAIAVALLAQTNPRNMIAAGLLWGGLWAGQDLVQARAGISRDLITVVKALIIMFVAADAIIRFVWRVPQPTLEEKEAALRTSGW